MVVHACAETILALNRNPDYCVYGYAQCKSTTNPDAAEKKFNELSLQERSKIQQETLTNVGGRSERSQLRGSAGATHLFSLPLILMMLAMNGSYLCCLELILIIQSSKSSCCPGSVSKSSPHASSA